MVVESSLLRIACLAVVLPAMAGTTFRDDRIRLNGAWRFQLRRDNQLLTDGPVRFGPVTASSQATFLGPAPGDRSDGRIITSVPWPLASTLVGTDATRVNRNQLWRAHPRQPGPVWWRADLGSVQTLAGVRIHWVKPGPVTVHAEISQDGNSWRTWGQAQEQSAGLESWLAGPPMACRHLKLTFTPAHFEGTRKIEIFLKNSDGSIGAWDSRVQRAWFDDLRRYTPADGFHQPGYSDAAWATIQVPGYWEVQRFSQPTWWQPDDTVGCYRRTVHIPERWRGRPVRWRLEGVNNSAQIWINGREVGYHESGFTSFEYDVTPYLRVGEENLFVVRAAKWSLTHEFDTDDVWFLGGIWRDTYLYSLPPQRIDDFTFRTEFDASYKDAVLRARVVLRSQEFTPGLPFDVAGELWDADGARVQVENFRATGAWAGQDGTTMDLAGLVRAPKKWTAETPYLYTVVLRLKVGGRAVHELRNTLGFRQVEVKGSSLLLNGVRLKLHGVVTTRANPNDAVEDHAQVLAREVRVLKESNINAIRSHTTPLEEDFLDACDKYGIYVLPDVPHVWVNEFDFLYLTEDAVLRAREIYEQHKNRASVILWHVGNENGRTSSYRGMGQAARWLHDNDPTRPVAICQNHADLAEYGAAISDWHYEPMRHEPFLQPTAAPLLFGEIHAVPEDITRLKDLGFVETWGRSLSREWPEYAQRDWVVGGLICCWDDGSVNGNLGPRQWGVVDSQRRPKAVAYHIRKAFAPVRLALEKSTMEAGSLQTLLRVTNSYTFTDLAGFEFRWEWRGKDGTLTSGKNQYRVPPGREESFPLRVSAPRGGECLRITVFDPQGFSVQNENFLLSPGAAPAAAGNPLVLRAKWVPGAGMRLWDSKGEELLTIAGMVLEQAKSREENQPYGDVHYEPGDGNRVPFTIRRGDAILATGALRFESGPNWMRIQYELTPVRDLQAREIGLRLKLGARWSHLAWDRDALWSSVPEGWLDGPRGRAPLHALAQNVTKRNILRLVLEGGDASMQFSPVAGRTDLRFGASERDVVLSEYTSSGDFLGNFDPAAVVKKLPAGQSQTGGMLVRFQAAAVSQSTFRVPPSLD